MTTQPQAPTFEVAAGKRTAARALLLLAACFTLAGTSRGGVIYVTNLTPSHVDGACSLREALFSANLDNNVAIASYNADGSPNYITTACVPGNGADTIVLPTGGLLYTLGTDLVLSSPYGKALFPTITTDITIEGNGTQFTSYGGTDTGRAFNVAEGGKLTILDMWFQNFYVQGGLGKYGGGGGMGAGGVIYVEGGNGGARLTVIRCTFSDNHVTGGNGGIGYAVAHSDVGGGGGLSGDSGDSVEGAAAGAGGGGSISEGGQGQATDGGDFGGGGGGGTLFPAPSGRMAMRAGPGASSAAATAVATKTMGKTARVLVAAVVAAAKGMGPQLTEVTPAEMEAMGITEEVAAARDGLPMKIRALAMAAQGDLVAAAVAETTEVPEDTAEEEGRTS